MNTVEDLILKLKSLPLFVDKVADGTIEENKEEIPDLNRAQLLLGLGADGNLLPKYVDDPFFKSKESALRYQKWKKKISPNTSKPEEVMDFYINGAFHNTIELIPGADGFDLTSNSPIASSVQGKTNDLAIGLMPDNEDRLTEILINKIDTRVDLFLSTNTPPKVFANV